MVPSNEEVPPKVPKIAKGMQKASSAESKEAKHVAKVCPQNPAWNPRLELDGAIIPWNSTIREFQRGMLNILQMP